MIVIFNRVYPEWSSKEITLLFSSDQQWLSKEISFLFSSDHKWLSKEITLLFSSDKKWSSKKKKKSLLTRSSNDLLNIQKDLQKVDTKKSKTKQVKKIP